MKFLREFLVSWLGVLCVLATTADAYWDESVLDPSQFTGYKPMYVLLGSPDAKLQLSLKARVLGTGRLYFAYTQLMLWNLRADSHPFRDLNFNPSLFYRWFAFDEEQRWIDIGLWEHESNGRDSDGSREWERVYLLIADNEKLAGTGVQASLKAWVPFLADPRNRDIAHYRGLCEINLTLSNPFGRFLEGSDLTFRLYPAGSWYFDPTAGGQELTLRLKTWTTAYLPKITFQIFHGYGEYLLDYQQSHWRAYLGLAF